jgi:hypothetical protein
VVLSRKILQDGNLVRLAHPEEHPYSAASIPRLRRRFAHALLERNLELESLTGVN